MMLLARKIPAWVITRLPVKWARRVARQTYPKSLPPLNQPALQLLIDISVIHQSDAHTGIQRVVRALLLQLLKNPPAGYLICPVYATRRHSYRYAAVDFLQRPKQDSAFSDREVEVQNGDVFLALDLAAHLLPLYQIDLLRWKRAGVELHVVVYDLLPLQHPKWFNSKTERNFKRWIRWLAIYANGAICISHTVKADLHNWMDTRYNLEYDAVPATTIVLGANIYASAPTFGLPKNAEELLNRLSHVPFVLMVGTLEPRKGYDQALAAFEHIWQETNSSPILVIVGRPGWKTEALQNKLRNHAEAGKLLFWLENASDEYLEKLYTICTGVLVASYAEGFGLPVVEAMLHGKPVLARDITVFREFPLKGLTYFDSDTPNGLGCALAVWLKNISLEASSAANQSLADFPTWELSAAQLLNALPLTEQASRLDKQTYSSIKRRA